MIRSGTLRGTAALVLGDCRQSLAVGRSLQAAGFRVIAGRAGSRTMLERSRSVAEVWEHPPYSEPCAWAEALRDFCAARSDLGLVFPVGDADIDLASPLTGQLPVLVVAVSSTVLEACRSKRALLSLAADAGVPTPYWETIDEWENFAAALGRVGLPAVLKPERNLENMLGFKAKILHTEAEVRVVLEQTALPACGFVLQRLAPGPRHNLYFIAHQGRLLGQAEVRILRTDRPDGTGLAVEGESVPPSPTLLRWTEKLAERLGYTGAGCAQFVVDEDTGTTGFLEVNARLGANCAAVCACGLDLPRLFVEALLGVAQPQAPARTGRRYAWLTGDLNGLAFSLRSEGLKRGAAAAWLGRAALAQLRAHDHITWSWQDPLPALAGLGPVIRAAGQRLLKWPLTRLRVRRLAIRSAWRGAG